MVFCRYPLPHTLNLPHLTYLHSPYHPHSTGFKLAQSSEKMASSEVNSKYKNHIIRKLEKNVVDDVGLNFVFSTGLALKDQLIDPQKAKAIFEHGKEVQLI